MLPSWAEEKYSGETLRHGVVVGVVQLQLPVAGGVFERHSTDVESTTPQLREPVSALGVSE
jgi:hypothetical protein